MKIFLIISVIFMATGCAVKRDHARTDVYPSSPPSCSTQSDEIDCQWKDVPISWHRAAERFLFAHDEAKPALFPHALSQHRIPATIALTVNAACDSDGDYPLITSLRAGIRGNNPYHTLHIRNITVKWTAGRASICPLATLPGFWDR